MSVAAGRPPAGYAGGGPRLPHRPGARAPCRGRAAVGAHLAPLWAVSRCWGAGSSAAAACCHCGSPMVLRITKADGMAMPSHWLGLVACCSSMRLWEEAVLHRPRMPRPAGSQRAVLLASLCRYSPGGGAVASQYREIQRLQREADHRSSKGASYIDLIKQALSSMPERWVGRSWAAGVAWRGGLRLAPAVPLLECRASVRPLSSTCATVGRAV